MIYGGLPQIVSFQSERQKAESISVQICLSANSRNIFNDNSYTVNAYTEATAYRFTIRFDFISSIKSGFFECFALSGSQRFFTDLNSVRLCILRPKLNCLSSKQGHRSISVTYVGTEELAHLEMVGTIVYQLTRNLTQEEIQKQGFDAYFIDHTTGVYPTAASGAPFSAACIAVTGDTLADINEDLAAEQKARVTYDNILRFADDPDVRDPIKFLREREIVHYQRFGEGLRIATDRLDSKNFYAFNPSFD